MFNFKKKRKQVPIIPENVGKFQVVEIATKTDSIVRSLGITDERADELNKAMMHAFHTSTNVVEAMSKLSKICNHANELYFASFLLTEFHSRTSMMHHAMASMKKQRNGGEES